MTGTRSSEAISISSLSGRVSKLETNVEVLGNRLSDLAGDIALSDKKQDAFFNEWRQQKENERLQKENERKEHERLVQSRQTTPRDLIMMLAACVTMCAALAGFGNYVMQTNIARATEPLSASLTNVPDAIAASITPLTERQNASSQASLQQRETVERLAAELTTAKGTLSELQRIAYDNRSLLVKLSDRSVINEANVARLFERVDGEKELRQMADKILKGQFATTPAQIMARGVNSNPSSE